MSSSPGYDAVQDICDVRGRRKRWWLRTVIVLLGVSSIVSVSLWLWHQAPEKAFASGLVIPEECLHFGEVLEDAHFQWNVRLRNTSNKELHILKLDTSCNCAAVEPKSLSVAAGEEADVRLTIDLLQTPPSQLEAGANGSRPVAIELRAIIRDMPVQASNAWTIDGWVRCLCDPPVDRIAFDNDIIRGGSEPPTKHVALNIRQPVLVRSVRCEPPMADVKLSAAPGPKQTHELRVTPHQSLPVGSFRCKVVATFQTTDNKRMSELVIPASWRVVESIEIVPQTIRLGAKRLDESVSEIVILRSRSNKPFKVISKEISDPEDMDIRPESIPNSAEYTTGFRISLKRISAGNQERRVIFSCRCEDGCSAKVTLVMSYYGVSSEERSRTSR